MQPIEEILKEFDRRSEASNHYDSDSILKEASYAEPYSALDFDKVRAFIEQALIEREKEAKLQRTKEILEMLPEEHTVCPEKGCLVHHVNEASGFNECLSQIKELLTKTL